MTNSTFDKTDKGREEISTRKYHLAPRLRTLLLLIDGKHSTEEVLKQIGGMGLTEESIAELHNEGYIQALVVQAPPPPQVPVEPVAKQGKEQTAAATSNAHILPDGQTQFEAIYHFYTETIKSTIGLRGYGLQLKVEKAGSIEEFRELRRPYLEAVLKAKGNEMARSLRNRLDELLYYGDNAAPHSTIIGMHTLPPEE